MLLYDEFKDSCFFQMSTNSQSSVHATEKRTVYHPLNN